MRKSIDRPWVSWLLVTTVSSAYVFCFSQQLFAIGFNNNRIVVDLPLSNNNPHHVIGADPLHSNSWAQYLSKSFEMTLQQEHFRDQSLRERYKLNEAELAALEIAAREEHHKELARQHYQKILAAEAEELERSRPVVLTSDDQVQLVKTGECPCGKTRENGCHRITRDEQKQKQAAVEQKEQVALEQCSTKHAQIRSISVNEIVSAHTDVTLQERSEALCTANEQIMAAQAPVIKQISHDLKSLQTDLSSLVRTTTDPERLTLLSEAERYANQARDAIKSGDLETYNREQNRLAAALETVRDPQASRYQTYAIADHVRTTVPENFELEPFESCQGNELQQQLHGESVEVIKRTSIWYLDNGYWPEAHDLTDMITYAADLSRIFAEGENYKASAGGLETCWIILQSLYRGGRNVIRDTFNSCNITTSTTTTLGLGAVALLCSISPYTAFAFGLFSGLLHLAGNTNEFLAAKSRAQPFLDSDDPKEIIRGMFQIAGELASSRLLYQGVRKIGKALTTPTAIFKHVVGPETTEKLIKSVEQIGQHASKTLKIVVNNFDDMCKYAQSLGNKSMLGVLKFIRNNPKLFPQNKIEKPAVKAWLKLQGKPPEIEINHIISAEILESAQGQRLSGYHLENPQGPRITNITAPVDQHGIYKANFALNGLRKNSTFFPKGFSIKDIKKVIQEAIANPIHFQKTGFVGETQTTMQIQICFDKKRLAQGIYIVINAYPLHTIERVPHDIF